MRPSTPAEKIRPADVEERFNEVIDEFGAFLRQTIARLCPKDRGIQFDDVEQEARVRLWRALQNAREIDNLASYIYSIAATATIDAVRRVKARRENQSQLDMEDGERDVELRPMIENPERSPARVAERREVIQKVHEALGRLSDNARRAVGLHLEGWTTQEIADLMGWSEPKARSLTYRGLRDLRQTLRSHGIEYEID